MNESNYGRIFHVFEIEGFLAKLFYKKCLDAYYKMRGKITKIIGKTLNIILHISSEERGGPSP